MKLHVKTVSRIRKIVNNADFPSTRSFNYKLVFVLINNKQQNKNIKTTERLNDNNKKHLNLILCIVFNLINELNYVHI